MNVRLLLIARLFHIASAVFNIAFVYTDLHSWEYGFPVVQYITMPLLVITGWILVRDRKIRMKKKLQNN